MNPGGTRSVVSQTFRARLAVAMLWRGRPRDALSEAKYAGLHSQITVAGVADPGTSLSSMAIAVASAQCRVGAEPPFLIPSVVEAATQTT